MSKRKNIQDMLEAHLDKIVLGLIVLIGLYLLWAFVLGNPYGVQAHGRKYGPGQIDLQNRQQSRTLEELLDDPAGRIEYDQQIVVEFEDLLRSSLPQLAVHLPIPYPGVGEQIFDDDRVYLMPEIIALSEVQVAPLRGAVHKPTEEVSPDIPYQSVSTELADLDFVTVSGRVDVQTLYRNFQQSFMGPRLNAQWREPAFAKPVFSRLELQRRQKLADGSWSDWNVLPRTQIDPFRKLIDQTPMTTEEMEFGGVMLWIKQFEDPRVQVNMLQPQAYDFASTLMDWLPPKYLDEAQAIIKRQEEELRRQIREERLRARETGGTEMTRQATPRDTRTQTPRSPRGGDVREMMPEITVRTPAAGLRRERTLEDVQRDMQQERITEQTKLDTRRESLLVWAHDDTARPGEIYQYRIRLGVFNPIAGRNWFREDQSQYKNQVVLWSDFSEPTKEVTIPKMMHIFPMEVLARDGDGGVKVDVARYYLGQWRTQEFEIFPGQVIGQVAEYTAALATAPAMPGRGMMPDMMADPMMRMGTAAAAAMSPDAPQTVDFTTPYMLVDINSRVEWGSNYGNRQEYSQMLYYGPERAIQAMAIGRNNWSSDMRRERDEIKDAEQNAIPLNLSRSTVVPQQRGREMEMPGRTGDPGPMPRW